MVYVITDGSGFVKIGSTNNIKRRISEMQSGNPRELKCILTARTSDDKGMEYGLHICYDKYRVKAGNRTTEWFDECVVKMLKSLSRKDMFQISRMVYTREYISGPEEIFTTFLPYEDPIMDDAEIETYGKDGLRELRDYGLSCTTATILDNFGIKKTEEIMRIIHADALHNITLIGPKRVEEIKNVVIAYKSSINQ